MRKRTVVVTGGSAGIGYAVAKKFLEHNDNVIIVSTNEEKGRKAQSSLSAYGDVEWKHCDVADNKNCINVIDEIMESYKTIDVLINNAGIVSKRESFLQVDMEDIKRTLDIDVMGTLYMASAATKYMVKQREGIIINVGSICGRMANTESVGYHAAKGAVEMITKSLGRELSGYGIRVVCVAPGWVKTEMVDETVAEIGASLHLKGRIIEPVEIAGAIYLLSLDEASCINGTTVMVDDGYSSFKGVNGGLR